MREEHNDAHDCLAAGLLGLATTPALAAWRLSPATSFARSAPRGTYFTTDSKVIASGDGFRSGDLTSN